MLRCLLPRGSNAPLMRRAINTTAKQVINTNKTVVKTNLKRSSTAETTKFQNIIRPVINKSHTSNINNDVDPTPLDMDGLKERLRRSLASETPDIVWVEQSMKKYIESGNELDSGVYLLLLQLFAKTEKVENMLHWTEHYMEQKKIPTHMMCVIIMESLCRNIVENNSTATYEEDSKRAKYWFHKFLSLYIRIEEPIYRNFFRRSKDLLEMSDLLEQMEMKNFELTATDYNQIIAFLLTSKSNQLVHHWVMKMRERGIPWDALTLYMLYIARRQLSVETLTLVLEEYEQVEIHSDVVKLLIKRDKNIHQAVEWLQSLPTTTQEAAQNVMALFIDINHVWEAVKSFDNVEMAISSEFFTTVMRRLLEQGNGEQMRMWYQELDRRRALTFGCLKLMVQLYDREGDVDGLRDLYNNFHTKTTLSTDPAVGPIFRKWKIS